MISKNQFLRAPKPTGRAHSQSPSQTQLSCAPQGDWSQAWIPQRTEGLGPRSVSEADRASWVPALPFLAVHPCEPLLLPVSLGWSQPGAFQGWERIQQNAVGSRLFEKIQDIGGILFWEERWLCRAPDQSWCSRVMRRHSTESQLCSDRKKQPWMRAAYVPWAVHLAGRRRPSWDVLLSSLKLHSNMYLLKHLESSYCSMCFTKFTHLIILTM